MIGPHLAVGKPFGIATGCERLGTRLSLPRDHEHVAVGEPLDVVMKLVLMAVVGETPHPVAAPVDGLDDTTSPLATDERSVVVHLLGAQEQPVGEELGRLTGGAALGQRCTSCPLLSTRYVHVDCSGAISV